MATIIAHCRCFFIGLCSRLGCRRCYVMLFWLLSWLRIILQKLRGCRDSTPRAFYSGQHGPRAGCQMLHRYPAWVALIKSTTMCVIYINACKEVACDQSRMLPPLKRWFNHHGICLLTTSAVEQQLNICKMQGVSVSDLRVAESSLQLSSWVARPASAESPCVRDCSFWVTTLISHWACTCRHCSSCTHSCHMIHTMS